MAQKKPENLSFEQAMDELEQVVNQLEAGDLPLEQALKQFERGISLTRATRQKLDQAEQQVKVLTANTIDAELTPFNETDL